MNNICDCCYSQSDNIQSCNYQHKICSKCLDRYRGKDCMFCNPLEKINNTSREYSGYIDYNFDLYDNDLNIRTTSSQTITFYFTLIFFFLLTFYIDGLLWILYNYLLDVLIYYNYPSIIYWYLPSIKQCIMGLIANSIIIILFLMIIFVKGISIPMSIPMSIPIFGIFF